jgi:hypothetical protein
VKSLTEQETVEINRGAVFAGFIVDFGFSELVGYLVMALMLALKGIELSDGNLLPADVLLVRNVVGVGGAFIGGLVAGWIARQRGTLHGVLGSVLGLFVVLCPLFLLGELEATIGDVGFVVLNLIGAGYGGGIGQRLRERFERER